MLLTIVESFCITRGSKEIDWAMGGVQSPYVKGSGDISPQMWLKLALLQPENEVFVK